MQPERFRRLESLFHRVVDLEPGARDALLAVECGDDAVLRRELEDMLARDAALGDPSAPPVPVAARDPLEAEGATVGPYRIRRLVARGGMGVVYEAEQREPIRRAVALKLVRAGMDSEQVVSRFEMERQALAMMEHPNVARVFDAGVTDDGRPFFAMELVEGDPITGFCEREELDVDARLRLFATVCDAVQHAHQKGVIHRDLKPSNVLVRRGDGGPVATVIDFGVAKAVDARYGVDTARTAIGELVGTPEYMSPEQARAGNRDIDTRTDVYALGVMLYELLTGEHPYRDETDRDTSVDEMLERVRSVTPVRPSARTPDARRPATGAPGRRLRGDLDWIVLRAMDKDRERRYASAADLAADIRRHLRDEPVAAGPPTRGYRLRKFVARHRAAVVVAALLLATLVAGGAALTVALVREARAEAQARRDAEIAERTSRFLLDVFEGANLWSVGGEPPTVRQVADRAAAELLDDDSLDDDARATLLRSLGFVYVTQGELDAARPLLERAVAIDRGAPPRDRVRLGRALMRLSQLESYDGRYDLSLELAAEAVDEIVAGGAEGTPIHGIALSVRGANLINANDMPAALEPLGRAVEILRRHRDEYEPELAAALLNLSRATPDADAALALAEEAVEIVERALPRDHPGRAEGYELLAGRLYAQGDFDGAADAQTRSIETLTRLLSLHHWNVVFPVRIQAAYLLYANRVDEARDALEACRAAVVADGGESDPRVGGLLNDLAFVELVAGNLDAAEALARRSLEILDATVGREHADTALTLHTLGDVLGDAGDQAAALAAYDETLRVREALGELDRDPYAPALFEAYARARRRAGDLEGARADIERAIALYDTMPYWDPRTSLRPRMTAATIDARLGRRDAAAATFDEAWGSLRALPGPLTMYDGRQVALYHAVASDTPTLLEALDAALAAGVRPAFLLTEPELRRRAANEPRVARFLTRE